MNQTTSSITETVLTILHSIVKQQVDASSSRENTPAWDSLKHIEVIFAIEDELGVEFSEAELADLNSVERIVTTLHARNAA